MASDSKKRRCTPSPSRQQTRNEQRIHDRIPQTIIPSTTSFSGIMPPSAPFLTWSPILLPGSPFAPLFPAFYPAALRSLPGFVFKSKLTEIHIKKSSTTTKEKNSEK